MDLKIYSEISNDVWNIFKDYLPKDANPDTFAGAVHKLDEKYQDKEGYAFMQKLLKVYFNELVEVKG